MWDFLSKGGKPANTAKKAASPFVDCKFMHTTVVMQRGCCPSLSTEVRTTLGVKVTTATPLLLAHTPAFRCTKVGRLANNHVGARNSVLQGTNIASRRLTVRAFSGGWGLGGEAGSPCPLAAYACFGQGPQTVNPTEPLHVMSRMVVSSCQHSQPTLSCKGGDNRPRER